MSLFYYTFVVVYIFCVVYTNICENIGISFSWSVRRTRICCQVYRVMLIFMMKVRETQNRDRWRARVNEVMNLRVPLNAGNFLTSWEPVRFSIKTLLNCDGDWSLKYRLDLRSFAVNKLPQDEFGVETCKSWRPIWGAFCDLFYWVLVSE